MSFIAAGGSDKIHVQSQWFPLIALLLHLWGSSGHCLPLGTAEHHLGHRGPLQSLISVYKARHLAVTTEYVPDAKYVTTREYLSHGLGNQLPGIVSAFFMALALNRTMLLEAPVMLQHLDTRPLDFSYANQVNRLREWGRGEPSPIGLGLERNADFWLLDDWRTSPYVELYENIWVDYDMDYPLAFMQANVHMQSFMKRYFPRNNPFYELAIYLLKLEPSLAETIMEARQMHFARHTIGVQVRRLKGHSDFLPPVENYARLALAIQQEKGWTDEDTVFFLATDTNSVYGDMMKALPGRKVVNLESNMTLGRQESANPGTLEDALIDMRLLSMCNEIVVTYGSSFGSTAAAWGGLKSYVMLHGGSLELNDALTHARPGLYSRMYTSEPCCWQCTRIMKSENATLIAPWQANPLWLHHSQCHW